MRLPIKPLLARAATIVGTIALTIVALYFVATSTVAQQVVVIFGLNSGAPKAITVDASGNVNFKCISGCGSVGGSPTQVQYNNAGALGGISGATSNGTIISFVETNIGAVSTDGATIQNGQAAAVGAQQWSPRLHFIGSGWKTNATAGAQTLDWICELQPTQDTVGALNEFACSSQRAGGGYQKFLSLVNTADANVGNLTGSYALFRNQSGTGGALVYAASDGALQGDDAVYGGSSGDGLVVAHQSSGVAGENGTTQAWIGDAQGNQPSWGNINLEALGFFTQNSSTGWFIRTRAGTSVDAARHRPLTIWPGGVPTGGAANTAGYSMTVGGGQGTGTGTGGSILFQTAPAGGSGTTQNALATVLSIDQAGHVNNPQNFGAPSCSTNCGTSPSVAGGDLNGIVTMGGTGVPASGWVLTFAKAFAAAPSCSVTAALTTMVVGKIAVSVQTSTTTMTVTTNGTAPGNSDKYAYDCKGVQ